jgi:hypothetical protein
MTTRLAERRRDLHNTSINFDLAVAGRCGFTHIPSGRVCQLPYRHPGPCKLRYLAPAATPTRAGLGQNPTDSAPVTATERRGVTTRNVTSTRCEEQT